MAKSDIKIGYPVCVCLSFFSAYVTGSFSFTNTHLELVTLRTLLVITTLKKLVC